MKQLLLSIAILALLTACTANAPLPRVSEQDASSVAQQDLSHIEAAAANLSNWDYLYTSVNKLSELGVQVIIKGVKPVAENKLSFSLYFVDNNGNSMSLPFTAYYRMPTENSGAELAWGGVSIIDSDTFAVCDLKNITFYDMHTLQELPLKLDLSAFKENDYYILGVAINDTAGIVVPLINNGIDTVAYFTSAGELVKTEELDYSTADFRVIGGDFNQDNLACLNYDAEFSVLSMEDTHLLFTGNILYNTDKKEFFFNPKLIFGVWDGYPKVSVLSYKTQQPHKKGLAIYCDYKSGCKGFLFDDTNINKTVGWDIETDSWDSYDIAKNTSRQTITVSCSHTDQSITLDFSNNSASIQYSINPKHLEDEPIAQSSDGLHSLYESSKCNRFDIVYSNIVLKDNQTQALRFLSTYTGMYGGYLNAGFFKNGEIYVQTLDSFQIFSPDPAVASPSFVSALPFGLLREEGITREIYTFRRDPEAKTFIILYSEHPIDVYQAHSYNPFRLQQTYKVGLCDTEGNLLESYDTYEQVQGNEYNLLDMNLWLSGDELAITGLDKAQNKRLQGVFNLKTHTYENKD